MRKDLEDSDNEDRSDLEDLKSDLEKEDKKRRFEDDAEIIARETLKDIVPSKDFLTQIEEGEKDIDELLSDATFKAKANNLGYNKRREQKTMLKKALNKLKNRF